MKKPIIAKDFLGNVLQIGDSVITIGSGYDPLERATITRFMPVLVDMKGVPRGKYTPSFRKYPTQLIKISSIQDTEKLLLDFFDMLAERPMGITAGNSNREEAVKDFLSSRTNEKKT